MGCSPSAFDIACRNREFKRNLRQFETMQLPKNVVKKLFYSFKQFDMDGSGSIGLVELLTQLDLPRTRFTEKVFSIFDNDGSGEIEFKEFVLSVWNYCTLTKSNLDLFAFDLYDSDSSGELSVGEVRQLISDIFGKNEMKNSKHAKSILAELEYFDSKHLSFNVEMFHRFMKNHQIMLFPAFQMQLVLQTRILGTKFWEKTALKRAKQMDGEYVPVGRFMLSSAESDYQQGPGTNDDNVISAGAGNGNGHGHKQRRKSKAKNKPYKTEAEELYAQNFLTTPDEQPAVPTFTESAKLRWAASVQAAANMLPTAKKGKRFTSNNKVTPEPSPRTPSTPNTNNKILSAVGFHNPSPLQSRQNSSAAGAIHASNSYNTLPNLAPLPTIQPMYSNNNLSSSAPLPSINKSDSNVSSGGNNSNSNNNNNGGELLFDLFDAVPSRPTTNNKRRGSKDYSSNNSPDKEAVMVQFNVSSKPSHIQKKKSTTSVKHLSEGGGGGASGSSGYDFGQQDSPLQSVKHNRRKSFGDVTPDSKQRNVRRGSFGFGASDLAFGDEAVSGRQKKERRGSFVVGAPAAAADGDAVSGRQKKERRGSFVVGAPSLSPDKSKPQSRRGSFNASAENGAGINMAAINNAVNLAAMQMATADSPHKQRRKSLS